MTHARRSPSAAISRLAAADERLGAPWLSLAPARSHARSLAAIGRALLEPDPTPPAGPEAPGASATFAAPATFAEPAACDAFADGLVAIALAMHEAFPHNLFGDLDHLAACLWRGAAAAPEGAAAFLRRQCACVVELQHLFGRATTIRFRYVHDFLYGFDWAKWVARDPAARAYVGPFSPTFFQAMHARGHELLEVIAEGRHRRYPPLRDARPRNAFGFSREPADELALHRLLAREGLVPVEAWRFDACPRWDRPFHELRLEHATRLGLLDGPPRDVANRPA